MASDELDKVELPLLTQLLTGKKRLKGFGGDTVKLGDITKITSAGVDKKL